MKVKITLLDPFNIEKQKQLSSDQKTQLLDILNVSGGCKSGKISLTKSFETEFNFDLTPFTMNGLISVENCDVRFVEISDKLYLTELQYNKLCDDFRKDSVDLKIQHFKKYKNKSKYADAYRTLRKWLGEENKFKLTEEQNTFAEKSYKSYIENTGCIHGKKVEYFKTIESYFEHGYDINDLREYLKKKIHEQVDTENKFVKSPRNVVKELMDIIRLKG